jgi:type II secretory ATPase GspE/PulE/Tfp pilus assembly ATPase PilB-like protein
MNLFGSKKSPEAEPAKPAKGGTGTALTATHDVALQKIDVVDPASQITHSVIGFTLTNIGGDMELPSEVRQHIVATSGGQIFYSKTERDNPKIMSKVSELQLQIGDSAKTIPVDASTVTEIYRVASPKEIQNVQKKSTDVSRMQREVLSLVANAARQNASDIHITVNQNKAVVQMRIDGVLREIADLQPAQAFEMLSATFAMADESDASYQMKSYQGARISSLNTSLPEGVQSLRLQFNPIANDGRYLIMRLLYSGTGKATQLEDLGYKERQIDQIKTMTARPVGINIVSGPTGSGKSTTLKAVLEGMIEKRGGEINLLTIEDPPEYVIKGARQMPVTNAKSKEERSEAFTAAISAGLRSDPNVMMIGEIRDLASADLAVEGALSGHPIYASLHANTAMDILSRLRDMGIEDFKVFDSTVFSGLVGQRLVRKLCPHCKVTYQSALEAGRIDPLFDKRIQKMMAVTPAHLARQPLYVASESGCSQCNNRGYKGRAVAAEIVLPDDHFMELMRTNKKREARAYWFETLDGLDLLGYAWLLATEGVISPMDIENEVALIDPIPEHQKALETWSKTGDNA